MASSQELSDFLRDVERRAFKQTAYAVRDDHAAMDIVQDAMLKLADKYPDKPVTEYPMLFQRILQNTMRDFWRRQKVRALWTTLLSSFSTQSDDGEARDPLDTMDVDDGFQNPATQLDARYMGLQVINPSNKLEMLDPTQIKQIITSEQKDNVKVEALGLTVGEIKKAYNKAISQRVVLNYKNKRT